MIPFDSHTHSFFSSDCCSSLEAVAESAISKGISVLVTTDHFDLPHTNVVTDNDIPFHKARDLAFPVVKAKYADKLDFLYGVEFGQPCFDFDFADSFINSHSYDMVICSQHLSKNFESIPRTCRDALSIDTVNILLEEYFIANIENIKWGNFDSLAHLTYPCRYASDAFPDVSLNRFSDFLDEIYKLLIQNGKALEFNTGGLYRYSHVHKPDPWIECLARYRELGGELLTIGSDAHAAKYICGGFDEGLEILKSLGFTAVCYYKQRKPIIVDIT